MLADSPELVRRQDASLVGVLRLSLSIAVVYLGQTLLSVVDTLVVAHLGTATLAAVSQGTAIYSLGFLLIVGAVSPLAPRFANALARRDGARFKRDLYLCAILGSLACSLSMACLLLSPIVMRHIGMTEDMVVTSARWSGIASLGLPFTTIFVISRVVLTSIGRPRKLLMAFLLACPLNALAGFTLTYGIGDIPGLGVTGAAIANVIVHCAIGLTSLQILLREMPRFDGPQEAGLGPPSLKETLRGAWFCLPVTSRILLAEGVAPAATLLAGSLPAAQLAAHVLALRLTALAGILALSLSSAAATVLAQTQATAQRVEVRDAARNVIVAALLVAGALGIAIGLGAGWWSAAFVGDADASGGVIQDFGRLTWIVAAYGAAFTFQIALTGVLLGLLVTRGPLASVVVGSWGVGILGSWAAFAAGHQSASVLWFFLTLGSLVTTGINLNLFRSTLYCPTSGRTPT